MQTRLANNMSGDVLAMLQDQSWHYSAEFDTEYKFSAVEIFNKVTVSWEGKSKKSTASPVRSIRGTSKIHKRKSENLAKDLKNRNG